MPLDKIYSTPKGLGLRSLPNYFPELSNKSAALKIVMLDYKNRDSLHQHGKIRGLKWNIWHRCLLYFKRRSLWSKKYTMLLSKYIIHLSKSPKPNHCIQWQMRFLLHVCPWRCFTRKNHGWMRHCWYYFSSDCMPRDFLFVFCSRQNLSA